MPPGANVEPLGLVFIKLLPDGLPTLLAPAVALPALVPMLVPVGAAAAPLTVRWLLERDAKTAVDESVARDPAQTRHHREQCRFRRAAGENSGATRTRTAIVGSGILAAELPDTGLRPNLIRFVPARRGFQGTR